MSQIARLLIGIFLINISICAQEKISSPGWDLSYESVLERNNVPKSDWIWTWVKRYKTPAAEWVSGWKGKPIVSSIMIEHPAFHAAEHTTIWLIRTDDEAFYWESIEGSKSDNEEPISPKIYDEIYKQVVSW